MSIVKSFSKANTALQSLVPLSRRNKHFSFAFVLMATMLDNFSLGINITTMYSIMEHFGSDSVITSWTLSAYSLTLGSFILFGGKLCDILGADIVFVWSIFFLGIAALINALIENEIIVLIIFRAVQGIFGAFMMPSAFAIAASYYQGQQLGYALGGLVLTFNAVFGVSLVLGGAFSISSVGYKGAFYLTFSLAMFVFLGLYFTMYPVPRTAQHSELSLKRLDYPAVIMMVGGVLLVILGLTEGGESWHKPSSYVPLVIGVLLTTASILFETVYLSRFKNSEKSTTVEIDVDDTKIKEEDPSSDSRASTVSSTDWRSQVQLILPGEAFSIPGIYFYIIATFTLSISFISVTIAQVQYFQFVVQDNALICGLKVLTLSIGMTIGGIVNQEFIIYRIGMKYCLLFSQVLSIGSLVWMSRHSILSTNSFWKYDCFALVLFGYSLQLYFSIYLNAVLRRTPMHLQGVVSGLLQTVLQVGLSVGNCILSSILGVLVIVEALDFRLALQKKFENVYYMAMALHAVGFGAILFIKNQKSIEVAEDAPVEDPETTV